MPRLGVNIDHVATLRQGAAEKNPTRSGRRHSRNWRARMGSRYTCARIEDIFKTETLDSCARR